MTVATVIAADRARGGVAQAAPHRPAAAPRRLPVVGSSSWVTSDGWNEGVGKGVFGERADATAVGGTRSLLRLPRQRPRRLRVRAYLLLRTGPDEHLVRQPGRHLLVRQGRRPVHQLEEGDLGLAVRVDRTGQQRRPRAGLLQDLRGPLPGQRSLQRHVHPDHLVLTGRPVTSGVSVLRLDEVRVSYGDVVALDVDQLSIGPGVTGWSA